MKKISLIIGTLAVGMIAGVLLSQSGRCDHGDDIREFESVTDSLYDYSMTICTALVTDNPYMDEVVSPQYLTIFRTYRVPDLEILLDILDEIDDKCCIADMYDSVDETYPLGRYYALRDRYEQFF